MASSLERARKLPVWSGVVTPKPLAGGLSNESFTVEDGGEKFVVRFGNDIPVHFVDRAHERMVSKAAFAAGFAPELVYAEPGVMVFRFVEGVTFSEQQVQANIPRIARLVRDFHTRMPRFVHGAARLFWVFHVIRSYAVTLEDGKSRMVPHLSGYLALADELEAVQIPLPIVFGHNDMLPANFIDDGEKVWLIDYEYAAFSTAMFDLAGVASNAVFAPEQDEALLAARFQEPPGPEVMRSHAAMKCASLLREAMWSMVSELHLDAPGADYVAYTGENLARLAATLDDYRSRFGGSTS